MLLAIEVELTILCAFAWAPKSVRCNLTEAALDIECVQYCCAVYLYRRAGVNVVAWTTYCPHASLVVRPHRAATHRVVLYYFRSFRTLVHVYVNECI